MIHSALGHAKYQIYECIPQIVWNETNIAVATTHLLQISDIVAEACQFRLPG